MIISHRLKFAFFANQRTGSKAVGIFLRFSGIFDENDILIAQPFPATRTARIEIPAYNLGEYESHVVNHMTPAKAIEAGFITLDQLREYDCYAFVREPEARFKATRVSMDLDRNGSVARPGRPVGGVAPPQFEFFFVGDEQVVTPLDFDNYEEEIRMLHERLGGNPQMDVPSVVRTMDNFYTVRPIKYEPHHHTKDIQLYKRMKNEKGTS